MNRLKTITTALSVSVMSLTQAQWLVQTDLTPGVSAAAMFLGGTGAYAGSVNTSISNVIDGLANGVPGTAASNITALTTSFTANYPTNLGGLPYLNLGGNDSGDKYKVTMDFTGLGLGYLPAGTVIGLMDVDVDEQLQFLSGFDVTSTQITNAWLSPTSVGPFDYNFTDATDFINPSLVSQIIYSSGVYTFAGDSSNQTSAFQSYKINQNLTKMEWTFRRSVSGLSAGGFGYGVAVLSQPVPEPSTIAFITLGVLGICKRRR